MARLRPIEEDGIRHRLLAEDHVLGHREHRYQHEMLVHHLDAAGDRVRRSRDMNRFPVDKNLALIGYGQSVQDVHEGGLAGAVLSEQGVDLARPQIEVDVVVGHDARIALRDAAHLKLQDGFCSRARRGRFA